jgi:hypothetical protein
VNLITIEQARAHCRADSEDDMLLTLYGEAAEDAAQNFLNRKVFENADAMAEAVLAGGAGDDPMVVTKAVMAAVLLILGHLYRTREDVQTGQGASAVQIPMGAHSLLWPYRVGLGV